MSMLVFLDRQHLGNPSNWASKGAQNGDDVEAYLTSRYIHYAEWRLRQLGFDVCVISDGTYPDRHDRVNEYAQNTQSVYVACHINAGGGGYCSVFYDHRSIKGQILSQCINSQMSRWIEVFTDPSTTKSIACKPDDWTKNAYYCIKGVGKPVAICFEPFFIDTPAHKSLCTEEGLQLVGLSLANGIKKYFDTITTGV